MDDFDIDVEFGDESKLVSGVPKANAAVPSALPKNKRLTVITEQDKESEITNFDNPVKKLNGLAAIVLQVEMSSQAN